MKKPRQPARSFSNVYANQIIHDTCPIDRKTPSRFVRSPNRQRYRAERAFSGPKAPGLEIEGSLGNSARLFTFWPRDLGLSDELEAPENLYDHAAMKEFFAAVGECFLGTCYAVAEVGEFGRLHGHAIAHKLDGLPSVRAHRDSERCKEIYDVRGLYRYLHKEDSWTLEAELAYSAAKVISPTGKLPRTRRHFLTGERPYAAMIFWLKSIGELPDFDLALEAG